MQFHLTSFGLWVFVHQQGQKTVLTFPPVDDGVEIVKDFVEMRCFIKGKAHSEAKLI
jgi:hypothetical protein